MQRYTPGMLPRTRTPEEQHATSAAPQQPLSAAMSLGDYIRGEHGREGAGRYVRAMAGLLPQDMMEQLAKRMGTPVPQPQPEPAAESKAPEPQQKKQSMSPEQMLKFMQMMQKSDGKAGGMDPMMLMKLMENMK